MTITGDYTLIALILLTIGVSLFAFRTTFVLFRIGAATMFLTILIFVMGGQTTVNFTEPWMVAFSLGMLCIIFGMLTLYMGAQIENGWITRPKKLKKPRSQRVQENYSLQLKERLGNRARQLGSYEKEKRRKRSYAKW